MDGRIDRLALGRQADGLIDRLAIGRQAAGRIDLLAIVIRQMDGLTGWQ